jgi:signal transduction histidine kinase/AmiR/NasT family two-component response regulator
MMRFRHIEMKSVVWGLTSAFIVTATLTTIAWRTTNQLTIENQWIAHSQEQIARLERLLSTVQSAQTRSRGYIISGKSWYLETYREMVQSSNAQLNELMAQPGLDADGASELADLRSAIATEADCLEAAVKDYQSQGLSSPQLAGLVDSSREMMEEVRAILSSRMNHENGSLDRRLQEASGTARSKNIAFGALTALELVLLILSYAMMVRLVNRHRKAQAAHEQAGADLRRAKEAADAANRSKSDVLANVSHEIRIPMTAIQGYCELLLAQREHLTADQAKWLETIEASGDRLLRIINDILDLSKVEAGKIEIQPSNCAIRDLVSAVIRLFEQQLLAKGLVLDVIYSPDVPEVIVTDGERVHQILTNLIGNAVKFTPSGGISIRISSEPRKVRFDVVDTGIGIAIEQIERLFQPFEQPDARVARTFGGSGLGLAISRKLARLLGGDLRCRSTPGVSTTFSLVIEAGPADLLAQPAATASAASATVAPQFCAGKRILVAEDSPELRQLIATCLAVAGATLTTVEDGRKAVEEALRARNANAPYDVIVMDINMPLLDGLSATKALRTEGYQGAIIAVSASAMKTDQERAIAAGCDGFVSKPMRQHELLRAIAEHIASASQRNSLAPRMGCAA